MSSHLTGGASHGTTDADLLMRRIDHEVALDERSYRALREQGSALEMLADTNIKTRAEVLGRILPEYIELKRREGSA